MGSFGAVVGATLGDLSSFELDVNGPLLAPGIGAQGATPADLPAVFGAAVRNVVPNVSRAVLGRGPDQRRPCATRRSATRTRSAPRRLGLSRHGSGTPAPDVTHFTCLPVRRCEGPAPGLL